MYTGSRDNGVPITGFPLREFRSHRVHRVAPKEFRYRVPVTAVHGVPITGVPPQACGTRVHGVPRRSSDTEFPSRRFTGSHYRSSGQRFPALAFTGFHQGVPRQSSHHVVHGVPHGVPIAAPDHAICVDCFDFATALAAFAFTGFHQGGVPIHRSHHGGSQGSPRSSHRGARPEPVRTFVCGA
jgi:hypothetical protein